MSVHQVHRETAYRIATRKISRGLNRVARAIERAGGSPLLELYPPRPPQSVRQPSSHLALITGHFSYSDWCATFGDTEAMRVVAEWLEEADIPFDIACHPVNGTNGVDLKAIDPSRYTIFIFVCGPWDEPRSSEFLQRFAHCTKIGINLSVLAPSHHGFDLLLPRDLLDLHNPDLVFASRAADALPLAGIVLVHPQAEYGERQRHRAVGEVIEGYLSYNEVAPVAIDTIHADNRTSMRKASQLENLLRRLDVVITTRLHGLVFSLKMGVPAVAIDPVAGGGKVTAQAKAVGWPLVFGADDVDPERIRDAVRQCLSGSMGADVVRAKTLALEGIGQMKMELLQALSRTKIPEMRGCSTR